MSTNTTPPPVGTTMKYRGLEAEVLFSSPEWVVTRDGGGGWFSALRQVDGEWRDHDGDAWEFEEPEPPTLPVGTVLTHGVDTRTVVGAAPGFVLVLDRFDKRSALAWIDKGWRRASAGRAWEVQP